GCTPSCDDPSSPGDAVDHCSQPDLSKASHQQRVTRTHAHAFQRGVRGPEPAAKHARVLVRHPFRNPHQQPLTFDHVLGKAALPRLAAAHLKRVLWTWTVRIAPGQTHAAPSTWVAREHDDSV